MKAAAPQRLGGYRKAMTAKPVGRLGGIFRAHWVGYAAAAASVTLISAIIGLMLGITWW
jgi:hypothetical protein